MRTDGLSMVHRHVDAVRRRECPPVSGEAAPLALQEDSVGSPDRSWSGTRRCRSNRESTDNAIEKTNVRQPFSSIVLVCWRKSVTAASLGLRSDRDGFAIRIWFAHPAGSHTDDPRCRRSQSQRPTRSPFNFHCWPSQLTVTTVCRSHHDIFAHVSQPCRAPS